MTALICYDCEELQETCPRCLTEKAYEEHERRSRELKEEALLNRPYNIDYGPHGIVIHLKLH